MPSRAWYRVPTWNCSSCEAPVVHSLLPVRGYKTMPGNLPRISQALAQSNLTSGRRVRSDSQKFTEWKIFIKSRDFSWNHPRIILKSCVPCLSCLQILGSKAERVVGRILASSLKERGGLLECWTSRSRVDWTVPSRYNQSCQLGVNSMFWYFSVFFMFIIHFKGQSCMYMYVHVWVYLLL